MNEQDYTFPKDTSGGFRWHIWQKCRIAIGRPPKMMANDPGGADQYILRFEPPLTKDELPLIEAIFADPSKTCLPPERPPGQRFIITDLYDSSFREDLGQLLGCKVETWFSKTASDRKTTDRIELHFSKDLSKDDMKIVESKVKQLTIGWV